MKTYNCNFQYQTVLQISILAESLDDALEKAKDLAKADPMNNKKKEILDHNWALIGVEDSEGWSKIYD